MIIIFDTFTALYSVEKKLQSNRCRPLLFAPRHVQLHGHVTGHVTSLHWGLPLESKMAPPRVLPSRKKVDLKDDAATDDGDFFRLAPLPLSIAIVILLIFYWVSVKDV